MRQRAKGKPLLKLKITRKRGTCSAYDKKVKGIRGIHVTRARWVSRKGKVMKKVKT